MSGAPRPELRLVRSPSGALPPHDLEAERACIATVLLGEGTHVLEAVAPEDFFDANAHRWIWEAARDLSRSGNPVDTVSVAGWLRDREKLGLVGGSAYLAQLCDATPSVGNVNHHARIVLDKARRRRVIAMAQTIASEGYGDVGDERAWITAASGRLAEVARAGDLKTSQSIGTEITWAVGKLREALSREDGQITGTATGLLQLDALTSGMHGGDLTFIGGPKKGGKTSLAHGIAIQVATSPALEVADGVERLVPQGVGVFTLEMPGHECAMRMACLHGRVDFHRLRNGTSGSSELGRLLVAADRIKALPIEIDADPYLTVVRLRAKIKRMEADFAARGTRLRLVVVDYLQLLDGSDGAQDRGPTNREREIAEIGKRLRQLTREMGHLVFLVLSQLNDKGELRESRALEQHAVNVWIVEAKEPKDWDGKSSIAAAVHVTLQRNGPKGRRAPCWFHPQYTLFSDEERPTL